MTRTIHADLLATQKKTAYAPSLSLSIQDNGLPHPAVGLAHPMTGATGAPTASVVAGASIVRAHVAGGAVYVQRITNPAMSAQWTTGWTLLTAGANYPALFYTGSYVVCVYQITAGGAVVWKRSVDDGVTWSAQQTIWTPSYNLAGLQVGVSGGATRSGLFYGNHTTLYFRLYDPIADTFAAAASHDYSDHIVSFGACWDSGNIYRLALALGDDDQVYDSRNLAVVALSSYTYGGAWGGVYIHVGLPTTLAVPTTDDYVGEPDYRSLANFSPSHVNLAKVDSAFWLTFRVTPGTGCSLGADIRIAVSDDGTYFSGSVKMGQANIADRLQPLHWAATGVTYLASDSVLLISTPQAMLTATQANIIRYEITEAGPEARIEVVLDNRGGTFAGVEADRLGNDMVLSRGAICAGGVARTVAYEPFVIEDVQWSRDLKRVRLTGHTYAALMRLWCADLNYHWRGQTLQTLVQAIVALGGVQAVTFDASTFWTKVLATFTLAPGDSALDALQALQQQFQFVYRVASSGALYCLALADAPAADYTFGTAAGEHPTLRARDWSKRRLPEITHVVVLGEDEHAGEKMLPVQTEAGFQRTRIVTRQYLQSTAECVAQALAMATKAAAVESQAALVCLPAFHLELWDAVQSDGWAADQVRYVTKLIETYNTERAGEDAQRGALAMPWYQIVTLADVDISLAGLGGRLPAPTNLTHVYTDDGHQLSWFYPGRLDRVRYFEVYRNTSEVVDDNAVLVYRGTSLQALAAYSLTAGDYFAVRAVGAGELASSWLWGGPYPAQQTTLEDKFDGYAVPAPSGLASLCVLALADYDTDESWSSGSTDTTHYKEGDRGLQLPDGGGADLTVALDMSSDSRFTDTDFVGVDVYAAGAITEALLFFKTTVAANHHFHFASLVAGWNHLKALRGTAHIFGAADWATIIALTNEISASGFVATFDHLWISKADPDNAATYNDTGDVWDFLPLQGDGSEWHVIPGQRTGEPARDFMLAQFLTAAAPANWLLAWHTKSYITRGVGVTGTYLKEAGQVALFFNISDPLVASRTCYAVELDTAADVVRLVKWAAGVRTQIGSDAAFVCAPGEEIWLGADWRTGDTLKVYASKVEGNLIQASNLLIAQDDATLARGGYVGVGAKECNARFFLVRAGSQEHVHTAEVSYLALKAATADALRGRAVADTAPADGQVLTWDTAGDHWQPGAPAVYAPPAGAMWLWPTATAPAGWLLCNGAAVSRTTYAALFAVIGTTFGVGDNSTTFNLPDLRDRSPQGASATDAIGAQVGVKLQTAVPQHSHPVTVYTDTGGTTRIRAGSGNTSPGTVNTGNTGTAGGVDQRGPRLAVNFIIKA